MALKSNQILKPQDFLEWKLVDEGVVVIDPQEGSLFQFNAVAARVWTQLDGKKSIDKIISEISDEFESEERKIRKDILKFLNELREMDLICPLD